MKGCYIISFDGSGFKGAFTTAMWTMVGVGLAVAWIPGVADREEAIYQWRYHEVARRSWSYCCRKESCSI